MSPEEKKSIELFDKIFQNMSLKDFYKWMQTQEINESKSECELEFEELDCTIEEYIKSEKLVLLDDLTDDLNIRQKRNKYKPK